MTTHDDSDRFTAETRARLVLARAITADFTREAASNNWPPVDWLAWSHRLNIALESLVDALDTGTTCLLDGGATISAVDLKTVRSALDDASNYRRQHADISDLTRVAGYNVLAHALGSDE